MELIIISVSNILCFLIGAIVGQKVINKEPIVKTPSEIIEAKEFKEEADKQAEKYKTIMENIDNYDGTGLGQKEIGG